MFEILLQRLLSDVVRSYDIDGVHFDDYFYPYPVVELLLMMMQLFNFIQMGLLINLIGEEIMLIFLLKKLKIAFNL